MAAGFGLLRIRDDDCDCLVVVVVIAVIVFLLKKSARKSKAVKGKKDVSKSVKI